LKNDRLRSYRRLAIFILLLHLFFFNYYLFVVAYNIAAVAGIIIALTALLMLFSAAKKNTTPILPAAAGFILLAVNWCIFTNYWLAIAMILLAFLDLMAGQKMQLSFSKDAIIISSFPKKTILWQELNNVILKDRILTIDHKNDHLVQGEIAPESFSIDEKLFNAFCLLHLPVTG
jgi:hypothetical protein